MDNDKKKAIKKKNSPNLFDALVLAIILAVGIGSAFFFSSGGISGKNMEVYFTVEFRKMDKSFADNIHIGDDIKDSIKGYYLGKVESFEVKQQTEPLFDLRDEKFVIAEPEDNYFVYITVKADGTESEREIKAEDVVIRVGKQMSIKGKGYAQTGYVVGLYTKEKGAQ